VIVLWSHQPKFLALLLPRLLGGFGTTLICFRQSQLVSLETIKQLKLGGLIFRYGLVHIT